MNEENEQNRQVLLPIEQQTITFYGKPIIVVRLPDGRAGVVLRSFCDNLQLEPTAQVRRVRRTEAIADDLVDTQVQTDGGPQIMPTLILRAVPFWLAGIDAKRVQDTSARVEIVRYQREVVDVLYEWAATRKPQELVPAEPITRPSSPQPGASFAEWRNYYQQMLTFIDWQQDVENWRGSVETRLEGIETIIPDILDRLPPMTISPAHQRQVQVYVKQLGDLTGKHPSTIYTDLYTAFSVPRYQDLLEVDWQAVENWFKTQIDKARQRKKKL